MTQIIEAIGWCVLLFAGAIALLLVGTLLIHSLGPLLGLSQDAHGFGRVLPVVGLVLFAMPGMLIGWGLVAYARTKRNTDGREV